MANFSKDLESKFRKEGKDNIYLFRFNDDDVEELYQMLRYEAWDLSQPLHFEELLRDLIHVPAYDPSKTILSSTSPLIPFGSELNSDAKKDEICQKIKEATQLLQGYWKETVLAQPQSHFTIVGGGAEAENEAVFMKVAEQVFGSIKADNKTEISKPASPYCGGMLSWATDETPLCNLSIALKAPISSSNSHIPLAILQMLLGGGGSFSAGGPGKGMYSRLYTQMLNRYPWLEHARAFSIDYQRGGLFGINASCLPKYAPSLIKVVLEYLSTRGTASLTSEELGRAKNQLKSAILMGLEARSLSLEAFAEQLSAGKFMSADEICTRIEETGEDELKTVAREVASGSEVSVVAHGQIDYVPTYQNISSTFSQIINSKLR